jgi:hypothetical protein
VGAVSNEFRNKEAEERLIMVGEKTDRRWTEQTTSCDSAASVERDLIYYTYLLVSVRLMDDRT